MTTDQDLESTPPLVVSNSSGIGLIEFNRPERLNAISNRMHDLLKDAWLSLEANQDVRCIVMTGRGRGFCVGLDLKEFAENREGHEEIARQARENRRQMTARDLGVTKPVICAVNGICAGGGMHFVVDADIVLASRSAEFVDPHVSVGQISVSESLVLGRRMPFGEAMRLALAGSSYRLSAARAYDVGLVAEVVDEDQLLARATELARVIGSASSEQNAAAKAALWLALEGG